jgi:biopolymer transport protein ExbD
MSRKNYRSLNRTAAVSIGWLFADLLLALAMLFLVANTITTPRPTPTPTPTTRPKPTPTPTPTPRPTPTPILRLETKPQRITITVDSQGLIANSSTAVADVKQKIQAQTSLQGRRAGLVIVYSGAPADSDITTAQTVDNKIYDILRELGNEHFVFSNASYYDPLYLLGYDSTTVVLDVYLFTRT